MKKKFFTLFVLIAFVISLQNVNATIRRVGYWGTPIPAQDYIGLQQAHDAANPGDTILVFPNGTSGPYTATFTKRLVVAGYGYLVTGTGSNPDLQAITGSLNSTITLRNGSDSTILEGLDGLQLLVGSFANATIAHVVVKRCNANIVPNEGTFLLDNWEITQSTFSISSGNTTTITYKNLLVENSFINSLNFGATTAGCTGIFNNDIFWTGGINFNNGSYSLANNIFVSTTAPGNTTNCFFQNNIATNNTIPPGNGNQPNVTISTVFVGYPTQGTFSNDGRFALAAGSPAIGAGVGGIDCGIFGGPDPYRLSGIPSIPSFYKISAPGNTATTNPYTITFSVRSNN
jgi:hypothetical protein